MLELNQEQAGRTTLFVEVILPLAISRNYTYRVPLSMNDGIRIGSRVIVQFGKSKIYTAIIYSVSETAPELYEAKYILDVLDEEPVVNAQQLRLWEWIAAYYFCSLGEVMQAALPAALKLASETRIILMEDHETDKATLNDKEYLIVEALSIQPELKISEVTKLLGQKTVYPVLKSLFGKGVIHISEEVIQRYKPKRKAFFELHTDYADQENLRALFTVLERAPKQLEALMGYIKLRRQGPQISKKELLEAANCGEAAIKALVEKGIFIQEERIVSRLSTDEAETYTNFTLTVTQEQALQSIRQQFDSKEVVLLHGITSSGKTLIYIRLIEEVITSGRQALFLLPEIALTTQVIERLKQYFGNQIGVYHSKFSDNERAETWTQVLKGQYRLVLGARSAVLLPFADLGLIIVDEEHETSYKQFDPSPRYHARDTAIYLAHVHRAKVLLGSATPSLESYYNAEAGKYGLATISGRFGNSRLPEIRVVSIAEETKRKTMVSHFTSVLITEIGDALSRKEQVILFQNRRGYTSFLLCRTCGFTPKCINCDVSLTYHKSTQKLHCHYCGYKQETVSVCPACGSTHIEQKGFGTEKVEDELAMIFPGAVIARMDLDATRTKYSFQKILADFEERKTDILVGTQMITKGLDFDHITLIGIINADSLLNYPDFRAYEKSFQLLSQVAGRAGRREKTGKVVIQAYDTQHRVLHQVISNDYHALYKTELAERKNFAYPPFYRLIRLDIKHKDQQKAEMVATRMAAELKVTFGDRILGPQPPLIARVRNFYIQTILIKCERAGDSIQKIKQALAAILLKFEADKANKGILLRVDVDPF
ncbi:replication restart helicase PriA [Hufsiella ginkgonis]|uniref:Replication restart protein PriA n=1 Tax=Hufsiella ginkgonis TaxID=2695274 RepID=A0A7K1XYL6_9SPHI|nr:primosomal protein N' [Hufsiella ginkgonis]MXV15927.1 primosomal protein N' [Hufsiella ginkgonis]